MFYRPVKVLRLSFGLSLLASIGGCIPLVGGGLRPDVDEAAEPFEIHPSVRVDSGLVVVMSGDVSETPLLLRFVETPPPYAGEVPAVVLFYPGQVQYEDLDALFETASPEDSVLYASIYPTRGILDEFWSWGPAAVVEGPDGFRFEPEGRAPHGDRYYLRWRRHVGPWYEVLVDAPAGRYMWTHVGDPRVVVVSYVDAMLQTVGSRAWVQDSDRGYPVGPDGAPVLVPSSSDTTAFRALRMLARTSIRSAPTDSAQVVVPPVIVGYDCLIGREVRGEWLRVVSGPSEACVSGELDPPLTGDGGWVRWTDGRDLLYSAEIEPYLNEHEGGTGGR